MVLNLTLPCEAPEAGVLNFSYSVIKKLINPKNDVGKNPTLT